MITIPILGLLEVDPYDGWLKSQPIEINALSGKFEFILEEYETDPQVEDFHSRPRPYRTRASSGRDLPILSRLLHIHYACERRIY